MLCPYCNSDTSDESNFCQKCGRPLSNSAVSEQVNTMSAIDEERQYPTLHWRCTWLTLFFHLLNAVVLAAIIGGGVWALYHFWGDNEKLIAWKKNIGIVAMSIPILYFVLGFISFFFNWFVRRYELRSKEIRLIRGIFNMTTNSTLLEALWGMKLRQNLIQRILGTGKITLFSDDVTAPVLHINDIGNVRPRFDELVRYQDYALDCANVKVERDTVKDTSKQVWRYSCRDLIDETIWGVLITAGLIALGYFIPWGNNYLRYALLLVFPVFYWIWLIWTFIDKICCTKYTLYNATLVKESGLLAKKVDVYVLCHIQDCEMSQNLWQKIVGDVGNITLYLKWENKDSDAQNGGSRSTTKKDVLHGLVNHQQKYETLKERWLRERHRRQTSG